MPLANRFTLFVPGKPVPQGSMKGYVRVGKSGNPVAGITNSNPVLIQWRMKVTGHAIEAQTRGLGLPGLWFPVEGPIGIKLDFVLSRPAIHYLPANSKRPQPELRESAPKYPDAAPDLDKLVRAVFDALTDARVWKDDGQVVWVQAAKHYDDSWPSGPGVHITLGKMP